MGEITYQGLSPFVLPTAQPTTAREVRGVVEMTVFASVDGQPPHAFPIQVRMPADDARQLAEELAAAAKAAVRQAGR